MEAVDEEFRKTDFDCDRRFRADRRRVRQEEGCRGAAARPHADRIGAGFGTRPDTGSDETRSGRAALGTAHFAYAIGGREGAH